ncbi:MAG TPA: hypothetical protein VHO67_06940 [Polyangia bacterium]|nr:hypothetical protein [Polyangia bacterium]
MRPAPLNLTAVLIGLAALLGAGPLRAQPMMGGAGMPNLSEIVGRPLPDAGMATGTVSVRVARRMPANAAAGIEVAAVIKKEGGELRRRTEKTDADGRVIFEGMVPGDEFRAEATVDGETLKTQTFTLPSQGGLRTMLIAALGAPPQGGAAAGAAPSGEEGDESARFTLGATAGVAVADTTLPVGRLDVQLFDENGAPIPQHTVLLGMVDKSNKIDVRKADSDAGGVAHFAGLPHGDGSGYAAVLEWHGLRLGTAPFAMPDASGARAEIRALGRTADTSVMTIGEGGRVIVQMHEDTLQFLEMLPLENTSDKIFDPGPGAVEIPLPQGFVGAEAQEGDRKVEVRQNHGMAVHGVFTPRRSLGGTTAKAAGQEVVFGFVLPYHGDTRAFAQPMPNGMGAGTLITEQITGLSVSGPGIGARQARELSGRKYWVMPIEPIPPGGVLSFTLSGLPSTDATGQYVAGGLALALIGGAFVFGRRPRAPGQKGDGKGDSKGGTVGDTRERLIEQRESAFAELLALERRARAAGAPAPAEPRKQLVARLEQIYRELAALDERQAA